MGKICTKCSKDKPFEAFYKSKVAKDGLYWECKKCFYVRCQTWRKNPVNEERARVADREYQKRRRQINKEWKQEQNRLYKQMNKVKIHAHDILNSALRRGLVVKCPCEKCGEAKVHAHHENYLEPLKVRWLCSSHHKLEHLIKVNK